MKEYPEYKQFFLFSDYETDRAGIKDGMDQFLKKNGQVFYDAGYRNPKYSDIVAMKTPCGLITNVELTDEGVWITYILNPKHPAYELAQNGVGFSLDGKAFKAVRLPDGRTYFSEMIFYCMNIHPRKV